MNTKLDENHDLTYNFATGEEYLKQRIKTVLLSYKWDCYFDLADGIDWLTYQAIYNENNLKLDIIKNLCKIEGIDVIDDVILTRNSETRQIGISVIINGEEYKNVL